MGALTGLRVADASEGVAGGYCTKLLASLGADVLKVERPRVGDTLRRAGPFLNDVPHLETSAVNLHLAAGKRSITLDVTSPTGASLFERLLETADGLVIGDHTSLHHSLGLASLSSRFPRLVVTQITPFGASGPRVPWLATELITMTTSGYLMMNGDADREPIKPYGHQSEYQAGLHAALGTLAAITDRDRDPNGAAEAERPARSLDVAISEAATFLTGGAIARAATFDRESSRNGTRPAGFPPEYLYPSTIRPTADGGYVYTHRHNRFPNLLAALMQEPRLAASDLLAQPLGHADETDAMMDRWLATRDKWRAAEEAQELRVPFTEVLDPGEIVDDRLGQHRARAFFVDIEHPVAGVVTQPGAPIVLPACSAATSSAPLLGEHNREVYVGQLGLAPRSLARLAAAGVI